MCTGKIFQNFESICICYLTPDEWHHITYSICVTWLSLIGSTEPSFMLKCWDLPWPSLPINLLTLSFPAWILISLLVIVISSWDFTLIYFNFLLEVGGVPLSTLKIKLLKYEQFPPRKVICEGWRSIINIKGEKGFHENQKVLSSRYPGLDPGTVNGHLVKSWWNLNSVRGLVNSNIPMLISQFWPMSRGLREMLKRRETGKGTREVHYPSNFTVYRKNIPQ